MAAFAKLVDDPQVLARVVRGFEAAIAKSFDGKHAMRHPTQAEVKRRFDLCASMFEKTRGDLKWGIERILGALDEYLDAKLDGRDWSPGSRTIWAPGDGA